MNNTSTFKAAVDNESASIAPCENTMCQGRRKAWPLVLECGDIVHLDVLDYACAEGSFEQCNGSSLALEAIIAYIEPC